MTTYPLSARPDTIALPNGREIKSVFNNTKVAMTLILSGASVVIALVVTLGFLADRGADSSTILGLVSTLLSAFTLWRVGGIHSDLRQVQQQTNGAQMAAQTASQLREAKLIDAAIASPPPERVR